MDCLISTITQPLVREAFRNFVVVCIYSHSHSIADNSIIGIIFNFKTFAPALGVCIANKIVYSNISKYAIVVSWRTKNKNKTHRSRKPHSFGIHRHLVTLNKAEERGKKNKKWPQMSLCIHTESRMLKHFECFLCEKNMKMKWSHIRSFFPFLAIQIHCEMPSKM